MALTHGGSSGSPGTSFLIQCTWLYPLSPWTRQQGGVSSRDLGSWTLKTSPGGARGLAPLIRPLPEPKKDTTAPGQYLERDANPNIITRKHQTPKEKGSIFKRGKDYILLKSQVHESQKRPRKRSRVKKAKRCGSNAWPWTSHREKAIKDMDGSAHSTRKCTD